MIWWKPSLATVFWSTRVTIDSAERSLSALPVVFLTKTWSNRASSLRSNSSTIVYSNTLSRHLIPTWTWTMSSSISIMVYTLTIDHRTDGWWEPIVILIASKSTTNSLSIHLHPSCRSIDSRRTWKHCTSFIQRNGSSSSGQWSVRSSGITFLECVLRNLVRL